MNTKLLPVKQSIILLDKPIWTPSRIVAKRGHYTDGKGYEIEASELGLPTMADRLILAVLLRESQKRENAAELEYDSMYNLAKRLDMSYGSKNLRILEKSLKRWLTVGLIFTFPKYYDEKYRRRMFTAFGVVDQFTVTNRIYIKFNDTFIKINQEKYSRLLNVDVLKQIGREISPFALRLYEILIINLHNRIEWSIGLHNFFRKMAVPYDSRYHNRLMEQLIQAVEELANLISSLKALFFFVEKNKQDEPILKFKLLTTRDL
jgi:hypothetical protein